MEKVKWIMEVIKANTQRNKKNWLVEFFGEQLQEI